MDDQDHLAVLVEHGGPLKGAVAVVHEAARTKCPDEMRGPTGSPGRATRASPGRRPRPAARPATFPPACRTACWVRALLRRAQILRVSVLDAARPSSRKYVET